MIRSARAMLLLFAALMAAQPRVAVEGDACAFRTLLPSALARRGIVSGVAVRIDDSIIEITIDGRARRVPRSPSCAADLDLVVLIADRQLKQLALAPDDRPLPSLDDDRLSLHLELGGFGGVEVGERVVGDLELAARLELFRFVEAMAGARVSFPSSVEVARRGQTVGSIDAWSAAAWMGAGVGFDTGRQRIFVSGALGLERTTATSADLFQATDTAVWGPTLGLEGRFEIALVPELIWLSIRVGGLFRPSAPTFAVEGAAASLEVPGASFLARAGVWGRIF